MVTKRCCAVLVLLAAGLAPGWAGAEEAAPDNHGYFGVGLMLSSNTQSSGSGGDITSRGGGIVFNGAGIFDTGSVGIGLTGALDIGSRTYDDYDVTDTEVQLGFDGGVIVADLLYLSLGLQFLNQTDDVSDITRTYTVVPFGVGLLKGDDEGYVLAQLRFGGGQLSNDQDSSTLDVGFFGLRLAGQFGTADGLQFMGGLEFDSYDYQDFDLTDGIFRFCFGVAFGG